MIELKGFKQVTLSTYLATSEENRKGYLWFVRDISGNTVSDVAIYLGNRKYADLTGEYAEVKAENLIESLGSFVNENGEWAGFLPIEEHEILGNSGVTSAEDAFTALEAAILNNTDAILGKVDKSEFDEKVAELESGITSVANDVAELAEFVNSALTQENEKIDDLVEELEITQSALTREIEIRQEQVSGLSDAIQEEVTAREQAISALTEYLAEKFTVTGDDVE